MSDITVFISYSHDSDAHRENVLALSERLRQDGIETRLDRYPNGTPQEGWPRWMLNQLEEANFVLVVCTETYYRRFRGHEQPGKGKGADWEGALITQELYDSRSNTTKFVPVFLGAAVDAHIPEPLRKDSYYALTSEDAYQNLYDFLLGQAGIEPGPLGELKIKSRRQRAALTFDAPQQPAKISVTRLTHSAEKLIGRDAELQRLDQAWSDPAQHVFIVRGIGGEGKTSLVVEWTNRLGQRDYDGANYFDWSFYSQGTRDQAAASSEPFVAAALTFFGGEEGRQLADSAASAETKVDKLLEYLRTRRTLLVLDGLEPLQHPPGPLAGMLRDGAMARLLKGLAQKNPGLCLVTTREPVDDLKNSIESSAPELPLEHLSEKDGAELLRRLLEPKQSKGIHQVASTPDDRMEISRALKGHALTLQLLGVYIHKALRDVRRWREVDYAEADAQLKNNPQDPNARYGHAFKTMAAYEQWFVSNGEAGARQLALLRLLGLFDRPASAELLAALRQPPAIPGLTDALQGLSEAEWNVVITELEACGLVSAVYENTSLVSLDTHPLLREYFSRQLREHLPEVFRVAHRRLYEYLCANTHEGDQPTLQDLQPLYQAVAHGCLAGMQQQAREQVYRDRILLGNQKYSTKKLGALGSNLGAVACFFEQPWSRISFALTEDIHGWLFDEAAFALSALGRLGEAKEPMRAALEIAVKKEDWKNAAISASSLSQLELRLGRLDVAVNDAAQAVRYADLSKDASQRMVRRTNHADALHQIGQRAEAEVLFVVAEKMQAKEQINRPLLYSVRGFRYCDLLLATAERAAWQKMQDTGGGIQAAEMADACRVVSERAAKMFEWRVSGHSLLTIALDYLTLGRAALLQGASPAACRESIEHAVDGLRRSGQQQYLPLGLLTRSWLRVRQGDLTGAQADLDEAWEIAERGPMPLYQADILLHRARLFFREVIYPWRNEDGSPRSAKADLAEARKLIEKHGYWRRKEELEDAEAVIGKLL